MAFDLLQSIKHYTYKNQQRCSTKELSELCLYTEYTGKCWHTSDECQEQRTRKNNAAHDTVDIICSIMLVVFFITQMIAQFKGGKAVATTYGYFLGLVIFVNHNFFWGFLFPVIAFFVILYITRIVSVSSMSAVGLEVLASFLIIKNPLFVSICLLLIWAFIVYRHRSNIERIKNGTESKVKWMGPLPGEKK